MMTLEIKVDTGIRISKPNGQTLAKIFLDRVFGYQTVTYRIEQENMITFKKVKNSIFFVQLTPTDRVHIFAKGGASTLRRKWQIVCSEHFSISRINADGSAVTSCDDSEPET